MSHLYPYTESQWERDQERLPGGPGCLESNGEPEIPAAYQGPLDEWHHGDTGRIITEARERELLSYYGNNHADKCKCDTCEETRNKWRDAPEDCE